MIPNTRTVPYPYQSRVIVEALRNLRATGFHGLFLDMGTGKTITTLYAYETLLQEQAVDHLIIIAPKALLTTWTDEMTKHLEKRDSLTWKKLGAKTQEKALAAFPAQPGKVFIVNVEAFQTLNAVLHSFLDKLLNGSRCLMAIDESSFIASPSANRTKAVLKLAEGARYRMILTGTEIKNSCLDLYTQFKFLRHDFWEPLQGFYAFRYRYAILEKDYGPGGRSFDVVVGYQRQDELMAKIAPHVSRIKKEEVLDLPPKRYQDVWLDMPGEMRRVYDELKCSLIAQYDGQELTVANAAVLFGRFRQLVGGHFPGAGNMVTLKDNMKLQYLVDDIADTTEKVCVWACFTEEIRLLHRAISDSLPLYGEISQEAREDAKTAFRDGSCRVLIANPAVAAFGLNLQFCRLVYWYSNPVSMVQRLQADERFHRPGVTGSVLYKDLLYRDSIDVRVKQLLENKMETRELFRNGTSVKDFLNTF